MNKAAILKGLSTFSNIVSALTGASALFGFLPAQYAGAAVAGLAIAHELQKAAVAIGDQLDDGQANGSFKPTP
jgi:hypothetical protein